MTKGQALVPESGSSEGLDPEICILTAFSCDSFLHWLLKTFRRKHFSISPLIQEVTTHTHTHTRGLNICVPPNSCVETFRRWSLWEVIRLLGHEDGALTNGISAQIKGNSLIPSTLWGHSYKTPIYKPESCHQIPNLPTPWSYNPQPP